MEYQVKAELDSSGLTEQSGSQLRLKTNLIEKKNTSEIHEVTYLELDTLITNQELIQGDFYKITDYKTKHVIPETEVINEGSTEPLICLAISSSGISKQVYSETHPKDYIEYDITNNLCEDGTTERKGFITKRIDYERNNECPYDHRVVKFRRWDLDLSIFNTFAIETAYSKGDKIVYDNSGTLTLYYCTRDVASDNTTVPSEDTSHWNWIIDKSRKWCSKLTDNPFGADPINEDSIYINADSSSYEDYYTFQSDETSKNNIIKKYDSGLNNIVFLGHECFSNTFGNSCNSNTFGNYCNSNTFGNYCSSNTFGNSCYSNTFRYSCSSNTFGGGCNKNTFGNSCSSNTFGNYCYYNTFGGDCSRNTFGNNCSEGNFGTKALVQNTFKDLIGLDGIDFSSATHLIAEYNCEIFFNSSGTIRLSYLNGSDVLTVVNVNS